MARVHSAFDRFASAAGIAPSQAPSRQAVSLALVAGVLAAVVVLMTLYVGVREITQPRSEERNAQALQSLAPGAGSDRLLSIEDIKKLADQD
jgi:hypothetical protein